MPLCGFVTLIKALLSLRLCILLFILMLMETNKSLRWIAVITAEKVDAARRELQLGETATLEEVKTRYRELAKHWHPDVCAERDPVICQDRFRKITDAKTILYRLIHLYNYSFRAEDIERDQEHYDIRFLRQFRGELFPEFHSGEDVMKFVSSQQPYLITVENIRSAANVLELPDIASKIQVEFAYQTRRKRSLNPFRRPDVLKMMKTSELPEIEWAHDLIAKYLTQYRYSFRQYDIQNYQEDAIERHRRQFGNEPMWAGGEYDDRVNRK